jgi:hypothetical protein
MPSLGYFTENSNVPGICLSNPFGFVYGSGQVLVQVLPKSRTLFPMTPEPSKQPYKELHWNPEPASQPASTGTYKLDKGQRAMT